MALLLFILGLLNALSLDHLMALSVLVGRDRGLLASSWVGLRFGLAHVLVLVLLGGLAALLGVAVTPAWEEVAERVGGVILIGLGLWLLKELLAPGPRTTRQLERAAEYPEESHVHLHLGPFHIEETGGRPHVALMIGGLFGLCGIRSFVLLIPVILAADVGRGLVYTGLFVAGTLLGLTLYGLLIGRFLVLVSGHRAVAVVVTILMGFLSVAVGIYWIVAHPELSQPLEVLSSTGTYLSVVLLGAAGG